MADTSASDDYVVREADVDIEKILHLDPHIDLVKAFGSGDRATIKRLMRDAWLFGYTTGMHDSARLEEKLEQQ